MKNFPVLMPVGSKTPYWLTLLIESGAVNFNADGSIRLDDKFQENIRRIHLDLAAGDSDLEDKLNNVFFNEVVPEVNNMFTGNDTVALP